MTSGRSGPMTRLYRYIVAIALVAAATLARLVAEPLLGTQGPFIFHFVAVSSAAWIGGLEAGVVAALASAVAGAFFFMEPRYSLGLATPQDRAAAAVFMLVAIALAAITSRGRSTEHALAESERKLKALADAATESIWLLDREHV